MSGTLLSVTEPGSSGYAVVGLVPTSNPRYYIGLCYTSKITLGKYDITTGQRIAYNSTDINWYLYGSALYRLSSGFIAVTYNVSVSGKYDNYVMMVDEDLNILTTPAQIFTQSTAYTTSLVYGFNDGKYIVYFRYTDYYFTIRKCSNSGIKVTTTGSINGCTIQQLDPIITDALINITANLTLNYCTLESPYGISSVQCYGVMGTGNVDLNGVKMVTAGGVNVTGDVTANYCQFVNVIDNYALKATGTISVNHCDFVNCYGAAKAATVNIINSIIYRPAIKQLDATTYTYSYSLDTTTPVAGEQHVIHSTPAYINDGLVNPNLMNLNLRMRILGYAYDSDAAGIASDGNNAGSLLVEYDNVSFIYDKVRLPKDRWGIKRSIEPVGEVKFEKLDGSMSSYKDALKEVITIEWRAMTLDDFEQLLNILKTDKSTVRVYFNPITNPNSYYDYTILYGNVNGSVKNSILLSSKYVSDVSITLTRGL